MLCQPPYQIWPYKNYSQCLRYQNLQLVSILLIAYPSWQDKQYFFTTRASCQLRSTQTHQKLNLQCAPSISTDYHLQKLSLSTSVESSLFFFALVAQSPCSPTWDLRKKSIYFLIRHSEPLCRNPHYPTLIQRKTKP